MELLEGLPCTQVCHGCLAAVQATVRDLYQKKDLGVFTGNFTVVIPDHGVMAIKLTPSK